MTKKNRGVTLVALVITIILLLIVSGITIAILNGNNGIINNAMKSKGETEYAEIKKEVIDEWYNVELKNVKGYKGLKDLEDELEDRLKEKDEDATVTYKEESETLEISFKGHTMDLTEKGKIIDNTEVTEVEKSRN